MSLYTCDPDFSCGLHPGYLLYEGGFRVQGSGFRGMNYRFMMQGTWFKELKREVGEEGEEIEEVGEEGELDRRFPNYNYGI